MSMRDIAEATTRDDFAVGKALIEEYSRTLGVDLCFQNYIEEIANLGKLYARPSGFLLLARVDAEAAGCVAVRRHHGDTCEMKRLYVRPEYRGLGLGRKLAEAAIERARQLGYTRMVLDTLPGMAEARALYDSLGFLEIEGYYDNPLHDVRYLARELVDRRQ